MNKGKIYISSTDYDLRDTRNEITQFLGKLGYEIINFESPEFPGTADHDRHDRCIKAVDQADYLVIIVDRRGGAKYSGVLYPECAGKITITRAECKRAIEKNLPIAMCVRNETWSYRDTYNQSKKKGHPPPPSQWVKEEDVEPVIDLLNELQKHKKTWLYQFRDVTDLKVALGQRLDNDDILGGCSYSLWSKYQAAFIKAQDVARLLGRIYSKHSGEIWLLNNDLELIKSTLFTKVYVEAFMPNLKISAIRLLLAADKYDEFTNTGSPAHKKLLKNFQMLGNRISDIYVGCLVNFDDLVCITPSLNVILYTSNNDPDDPDSVALLRPHFSPFCAGNSGALNAEDMLIACRQPHLPEVFARMKSSFLIHHVFQNQEKFMRLGLSKDNSSLVLQQQC